MVTIRTFISIDRNEAIQMLEGGKPVEIISNEIVTVIPSTSHRDTAEWRFWIYPGTLADGSTNHKALHTTRNAPEAVEWALDHVGE